MWVVSCPSGRFTPIGKHCVKETASEKLLRILFRLDFSLWKRYLIKF